ncbi:MAG: ACP S-malonyltransferase [Rhabdochlamydiaceae bacterium]|nr:ACP S-malonyltransferase [Rhabdochlamydiaceae bacterium]
MSKKAFIFPGQGAQVVGMGKDFYEAFSVAREMFEEASDVLSQNMKELIFSGPMEELSQTKNSQPAIFITSAAILKTVREQFPNLTPFVCAGLSLGEYTALFAAEKISFSECLKLVAARGAYMQEACGEKPSTMRVVLGLDPEVVKAHLPENIWIANLNCPGQVVIAGLTSQMPVAEELLKAQGARRVLPLEVSGAFHTPLMRSAQLKLESQLRSAQLEESSIEIVMNVPGDFAKTIPEIRSNLIDQVASPTRWEQGIRKIEETGVDLYIEMGPGKTLAGMNKKIGATAPTISIEKVSELESLNETARK